MTTQRAFACCLTGFGERAGVPINLEVPLPRIGSRNFSRGVRGRRNWPPETIGVWGKKPEARESEAKN